MSKPSDIKTLIHSPAEASAAWVRFAEQRREGGLMWGIQGIDMVVAPAQPGDLIGILARPGHCKTTLAVYLAKKAAREAAGRNGCVVYVTADQSVEQIETIIAAVPGCGVTDIAFGRASMEAIRERARDRVTLPIWVVGEAISRRQDFPPLTFDNILAALTYLDAYEIQPHLELVIIDYIQAIPSSHLGVERIDEVTEAIHRAKSMARRLGVPLVLCVQASRDVDRRDIKLPNAGDCQWASAIEQDADVLLSLWRPFLTEHGVDSLTLRIGNAKRKVLIAPGLLVVGVTKQKAAPAGDLVALNVAPEYLEFEQWEHQHVIM